MFQVIKRKFSKIKRAIITTAAMLCALSVCTAINAYAASVEVTATSSKVSVILTNSSPTTLVVNPVSCREKHTQTGALNTVKDNNGVGNSTSVAAVIRPHTGYKFINAGIQYNYYTYSVDGQKNGPIALPKIS